MAVSVGIMSMQRIFNYGSSLQAYGLRRLIEGVRDDATVSFLDFEPGEVLVDVEAESAGRPRRSSRLRRAVSKVDEYRQVDAGIVDKVRFFDHKRAYGRRYFPMIGVPLTPNRDLGVDVQVIGSDEVFNCVQSNTNVGYSRELFGHGSPAGRVVTYAASFGNTTIDKIDEHGIRSQLSDDLGRLHTISVRDLNSARIVETLTGRVPEIHVDPVLAHDFMGREPRIPVERQVPGRYLVVYGYSGRLSDNENEAVRRHADTIEAEVICLGGVQACGDRFVDCDPFELIAYFRDAEAVVTDTFHGTILAIINRRPFCSLIRQSHGHGYGNEEKLGYLLDTMGLPAQRTTDAEKVSSVLSQDVDYDAVGEALELQRARTLTYLRGAIG